MWAFDTERRWLVQVMPNLEDELLLLGAREDHIVPPTTTAAS